MTIAIGFRAGNLEHTEWGRTLYKGEQNISANFELFVHNVLPLQKYSAVLQNWANWLGQAGTRKRAE